MLWEVCCPISLYPHFDLKKALRYLSSPLTFTHHHGSQHQPPIIQFLENQVHSLLLGKPCGVLKERKKGNAGRFGKALVPLLKQCQLNSFLCFYCSSDCRPFYSFLSGWFVCAASCVCGSVTQAVGQRVCSLKVCNGNGLGPLWMCRRWRSTTDSESTLELDHSLLLFFSRLLSVWSASVGGKMAGSWGIEMNRKLKRNSAVERLSVCMKWNF